jgi:hypothetical protein
LFVVLLGRCNGRHCNTHPAMPTWDFILDSLIRGRVPGHGNGSCHHGMARPQVAFGGTVSNMESSCEYIK